MFLMLLFFFKKKKKMEDIETITVEQDPIEKSILEIPNTIPNVFTFFFWFIDKYG